MSASPRLWRSALYVKAGIGKKRREQDKGLVDEVSAVIILQSYLESRDGLGAIHLPFK